MRHAERGTSMIEFTLSVSVLLLVIFGILEFGRALYAYHTVSNAARLATRWAIVRGSACTAPLDHCNAQESDVKTYVQSQIFGGMDASQVTVSVNWPGNGGSCTSGSNAPGCPVQVTVAYPFRYVLPFIGSQLNVTSRSEMIIAQ